MPAEGLGVRVHAEEDAFVDERVLLLCPRAFLYLGAGGANNSLNLRAVDETGNVGVGDLGGRKAIHNGQYDTRNRRCDVQVVLLVRGNFVKGAEHLIEQIEGTLCPNDEAAEVSTRGKLEEIQAPNIDELDTRQVAECLNNAVVLVEDDKRATTLAVAAVTHLTLASTEFTRVRHLSDIRVGIQGFEESDSFLGFLEGLCCTLNYEGNLSNLLNAVTTGQDKGWKGRSCKCGDGSKATLILVDLDVPFAPSLGGSKHTTATAHVSKGSLRKYRCVNAKSKMEYVCYADLTGAVGTSTTDTRNTSNSTTSAPGLCGSLVTGFLADSVSLTPVFSDAL